MAKPAVKVGHGGPTSVVGGPLGTACGLADYSVLAEDLWKKIVEALLEGQSRGFRKYGTVDGPSGAWSMVGR